MNIQTIVLAGGCFWGMEELLRALPGVTDTEVGYTGGDFANPTYTDMRTGKTGHAESIRVSFDPARTDLKRILAFFFQIHDPTTPNRQGNDKGPQYRSAIFYADDAQLQTAQSMMQSIARSRKWPGPLATKLAPLKTFYSAESYHQDYLQKNPGGYTCHWMRPGWVVED
jgi:peptide-methionine (S)-S-oxide reductase